MAMKKAHKSSRTTTHRTASAAKRRAAFVQVARAEQEIKVGVVGAGFIIPAHTNAWRHCGSRIVSACDKDLKRAKAVVAQTGGRAYRNVAALIESEAGMPEDEKPDVIVVATPNDMHEKIALMALAAGFALDLEKPVTTTVAGARRIQTAACSNGIPVGVATPYRFDFHVAFGHWMIANGYIGDLLAASVDYLQGWGNGGRGWRGMVQHNGPAGVMGDVGGTHAHNIYDWLSGGIPITSLRCDLRYDLARLGEETDDSMFISATGLGGITVRLQATQTRHGNFSNTRRFVMAGSEGTLILDSRKSKTLEWGVGGKSTLLPDDPGVLIKEFPQCAEFLERVLFARPGGDHFDADFNESWARYVRHLKQDVLAYKHGTFKPEDQGPYAGIDAGVTQVELIALALESHQSHAGGIVPWNMPVA